MNTERFLWPVIIAAGLHGALLLSFSDKPVVDHPPADQSQTVGSAAIGSGAR